MPGVKAIQKFGRATVKGKKMASSYGSRATKKQFQEVAKRNKKEDAKRVGGLRGTKSSVKARGASTNGKKRKNKSGMKALTKSGG